MKRHLLILIMAMAPMALLAQPPGPDFTALKSYLNLTDAQVTSLTGVMQSQHEASRGVAADAQSKRQAFNAARGSGTADAATLGNLMLAVQASEKKMQSLHEQYQSQAVAVLTADQQTKLKVLSDAAALAPQIQQAARLNLITPPARGGPGFGRMGHGGPGMPPPPPGPAPQDQ